jgi:hypothetical protein
MSEKIRHQPNVDPPPTDPLAAESGLENLISPLDPSSMSRAEDDDLVFARSPEFSDRPGQGVEPPPDPPEPDEALVEGPGPAEGRTDNKAGG